jgi:hypothetical protein
MDEQKPRPTDRPPTQRPSAQRSPTKSTPTESTAEERVPTQHPTTARDTLVLLDEAWRQFRGAVDAIPGEYLDLRLQVGGWTRKQMLAHISVWHDLTVQRLNSFMQTGQAATLSEHEDVINARAARAAEGRTAGEIMQNIDDSYRRLYRLIGRLSNDQLQAHDGWAGAVIAGNTYDHYREHRADLKAGP